MRWAADGASPLLAGGGVGDGGEAGGGPVPSPDPPAAGARRSLREALGELRWRLDPRSAIAVAVVCAAALAVAGWLLWNGRAERVEAPASGPGARPAAAAGHRAPPARAPGAPVPVPAPAAGQRVVVDVAGKVRHPGLQRLPGGSRVADALRAAGGARPGTDLSGLNLARRLTDGEQLRVGLPGAPAEAPGGPPSGPSGAAGDGAAGAGPGGRVSLATATEQQLDALPGIGPQLAQRIIDYRTAHGGFASVAQLRQVPGIGDRRFAELSPHLLP